MRTLSLSAWHLTDWERLLARAISGLWALFWLWFGLASGISEGLGPKAILMHTAVPGLVFLAMAAFAWWNERAGSYVFLFAGLFIYGAYWHLFGHRGFEFFLVVGSMLALPALIAGFLFYTASRSRD